MNVTQRIFRLLLRLPVPWVFVLTYLIGAALERAWRLGGEVRGGRAIGVALMCIGAIIAGWALAMFHRARTTTVPGETSTRLVMWGPYRFTRNPMYVGLTLAYLGEAGILQQLWPLILLPLCLAYVNWVVIPLEEARLSEIFGDSYESYRLRVRRWI
jgi:protein-S-isoprenylcysteine O-methyltransferase Ste14